MTTSTVSDNTADDYEGGGIANGGNLMVTDSTLSGNAGGAFGGGAIYNGGTLTLANSTLSGNSSHYTAGGALDNVGNATVTNSTLSGNNFYYSPCLNTCPDTGGGGILNSGTLTIGATIVANSLDKDCGTSSGTADDVGYNLDDDGTCGFSSAAHDLSDTNPLLDPSGLQNNGGPTQTVALEPTSPAIGAVASASACSTPDQRGTVRPTPCDIGAYETGLVRPTTSVLIPSAGAALSGRSAVLDAFASNATSVRFLLFGGTFGFAAPVICTTTPKHFGWLCRWNTTTVPNGSYVLVSAASNAAGTTTFSSGVRVKVNNSKLPSSTREAAAR